MPRALSNRAVSWKLGSAMVVRGVREEWGRSLRLVGPRASGTDVRLPNGSQREKGACMRRLLTLLVIAVVVTAVLAAPAGAAPINKGSVEVATCEGLGTVSVLVTRGEAPPFWGLDQTGNLDGSKGLLGSLDVRVYLGALTVEPDPSTAVFAFSKTFGQKNGLGESIHCTFVDTVTDETGTFTAFGDVDVFLQR